LHIHAATKRRLATGEAKGLRARRIERRTHAAIGFGLGPPKVSPAAVRARFEHELDSLFTEVQQNERAGFVRVSLVLSWIEALRSQGEEE